MALYPDQILLLAGIICAGISVVIIIFLIFSYRKSRMYRDILNKETENFDALKSTFQTMTTHLTQTSLSGTMSQENTNETVFETELPPEATVFETETLPEATVFETELAPGAVALKTELTPGARAYNQTEPMKTTTSLIGSFLKPITDFKADVLQGEYELLGEISGGGMSRVFLAKKLNTGNNWIVKFIPSRIGKLTNEADILKQLNYKSLPRIIDIFYDERGIYLVQSFIEGVSLDKLLRSEQNINEFIIIDWAVQLAQALSYLHRMEPMPILHLDLKPSNVMVTHDNELMLIDFGVSKQHDSMSDVVGATLSYAAPEQLKREVKEPNRFIIDERFGTLPEERISWNLDERTDIFSLGVILFEIAVGNIPTVKNRNILRSSVSSGLCRIIYKCIEMNPSDRYLSAEELLNDILQQRQAKVKMVKSLLTRRIAVAASVLFIFFAGGSMGSGSYLGYLEALAAIHISPGIITVSVQQSSEMKIEKSIGGGSASRMSASELTWDYSADRVAQVDGNRVIGLNVGETSIYGMYRNKEIALQVNVVEPVNGVIEISQRFQVGHIVELYAGSEYREHIDGYLNEAEFVAPESMDTAGDGSIYLSDSGVLRKISGGRVETIVFDPPWLTPNTVRCYQNDVVILTNAWQDGDDFYYGLIRLSEDNADGLYMTDAVYTSILDFDISTEGHLYFIEKHILTDVVYLKMLKVSDPSDIVVLQEVLPGVCAVTLDGERVFMADDQQGVISVYENGALYDLAGAFGEQGIIDGTAALFFMPSRIKYKDDFLYVWDFNVLRRISLVDGVAQETITLAGVPGTVFPEEIVKGSQRAEHMIWPNSQLTDIAVTETGVLVTDPKRGVIWKFQ